MNQTFKTEKSLVDEFVQVLAEQKSPWGDLTYLCEFNYSRGRTDVVALDEHQGIIAFEAKLLDWKTALHQAYRNTCYANHSYVLLPKAAAIAALDYVIEFERRGVGLCYIDEGELVVAQQAPFALPLEPWLASQAVLEVRAQCLR